MTVSVDGLDFEMCDPNVDPSVFEAPMTPVAGEDGVFEFSDTIAGEGNLKGRRIVISTDEGGSDNAKVK